MGAAHAPGLQRTATSISSRKKIQRRPSLRPGSNPRRAYSSTVESGRCSSSATSRPSRTSSRVSRGWAGMDVGMVLIDLWAEKWLSGVNDREPAETANEFIDAHFRLSGDPVASSALTKLPAAVDRLRQRLKSPPSRTTSWRHRSFPSAGRSRRSAFQHRPYARPCRGPASAVQSRWPV